MSIALARALMRGMGYRNGEIPLKPADDGKDVKPPLTKLLISVVENVN